MIVEPLSREFNQGAFYRLVDFVVRMAHAVGIDDNYNCQVIQIAIPATTEIRLPHALKTTPKYRIIHRQIGNGLVTDGAEAWTNSYITLTNNGAVEVLVTVGIYRS